MSLEDKVKWVDREDRNQSPLEFFRQHYDTSKTRASLSKTDNSLYAILSKRRLLNDAIPHFDVKASETGKKSRTITKYGSDLVDYYNTHYPGLTRAQLMQQDPTFYSRLKKAELVDKIPGLSRVARDFGDPVEYYKKHHAGLTRGQLSEADPSLHKRLQRDGLIDKVPRLSEIGDDPLAYYNEHHAGLTRGQLQKQNRALYVRLWKAGLLDQVYQKPTGK